MGSKWICQVLLHLVYEPMKLSKEKERVAREILIQIFHNKRNERQLTELCLYFLIKIYCTKRDMAKFFFRCSTIYVKRQGCLRSVCDASQSAKLMLACIRDQKLVSC